MRVGLLVGPLTTIPRRQSEYPFCNGTRDKAGGNIARPMRKQDHPGCDQPCADAPDHIALPYGKRTGRRSQRPHVHGMAGRQCIEPFA